MLTKRTKNILVIVIVLGCVIIGFLFFSWRYYNNDKKQKEKLIEQLAQQYSNNEDSINILYNEASMKLDSLTGNNVYYKGATLERKIEIDSLRTNIRNERNKANVDSINLKNIIVELNLKVDSLIIEVQKQNK